MFIYFLTKVSNNTELKFHCTMISTKMPLQIFFKILIDISRTKDKVNLKALWKLLNTANQRNTLQIMFKYNLLKHVSQNIKQGFYLPRV